jgi:flagellin-like hook-associated protein FlgL
LKAGISQMQRSQIFAVKDSAGILANGSTQLQSIAQFYNANGVFVLETPLTVAINGNSKSSSVILDAQMTLDDVASAFQNAINSSNGLGIKNSRVATINTAQTNVSGLGGYIEIISGNVGDLGEISISGDQSVIDAFGWSVSRESTNNRVEMTVSDSFGNVRKVKTETNRGVGLLNGIDVMFESQPAQIAGTSGLESGLKISPKENLTLGVGTASVIITIQAGFWTMEGLARSINYQIASAVETGQAELLGLNASVVEGEIRLTYDKPATAAATLSTSIVITSASATTLGFVNGSYSGFVDGVKNQECVEWGFSQYIDTAKNTAITVGEAVVISLSDGVTDLSVNLITAAMGITAATIADMRSFERFQASVNAALEDAGVAVRIDQHGGAMAFTSLYVGKYHESNQAFTSLVSLNMADDDQAIYMQTVFGVKEGTAKGYGDSNYRMHVVDSSPQFHIGADQGQTMRIGIADMGSKALGVDNIDLTTVVASQKALGKINKAIDLVSSERSKMGAFQNRLEYAINNLRNTHSNLTSSESRIRDADIANEMIEFTRNQIVSQSGTAMLAQANLIPQGVLQLLQ